MKPRTRIAGIIIQDGKLLMLKGRGYKELWTPGGHLEIGESEEECLKRELKEEIGVTLVESKFFGEYPGRSFYFPDQVYNKRVYTAKIKGTIKPDAEIEDYVWVTKEDFIAKKYPMITDTEEKIIPDLIKAGIW